VWVIVAIAIAIAGFYFWQQNPSGPLPAAETQISPDAQQAAKAHINRLTDGSETPIEIGSADNFVTSDQLLSLPEKQTSSQIALSDESASNAESGVYGAASHLQVIGAGTGEPYTASSIKGVDIANQIKLRELLDDPNNSEQKVYFIHAVNEGDDEGLWGIIQHGLMRTFTKGLSLPGLDRTVYVDIPKEADEKLADKRSSFLGKVLKQKVDKTYIYNYQKGILGENPDLIKPGQQLIIVTFTEQELIGIYDHFVNL
jgi:hypothetical protein